MDLFSHIETSDSPKVVDLGQGLFHLPGFCQSQELLPLIHSISQQSPFRHMMTPMGHPTQVAMSNCGPLGWVASPAGYGYQALDPLAGQPWPEMPAAFSQLAKQAASLVGIEDFDADACLINRYEIGQAMGRHQDKDELDFHWPIVSVSLGLSCVFQVFGSTRQGKAQEILLQDGDVFILSAAARRFYHGVKAIKGDALQPKQMHRHNLTFRRAR